MSQDVKDKMVGMKINNLPPEMTEDNIAKLLKEHDVKTDIESVNVERNISVTILYRIGPECIMAAIAKLDFKETKKKLL